MIVSLSIICVVLFFSLIASLYMNWKLGKIILEVETALEESLDVCDSAYNNVSKILELPVALDTPEVRHVITEIKSVRDAVFYVSNVLAEPYGGVTEEKVDDV